MEPTRLLSMKAAFFVDYVEQVNKKAQRAGSLRKAAFKAAQANGKRKSARR